MEFTSYELTIYRGNIIVRETEHATRAQALRSIRDYERRHGCHAHVISGLPQPAANDTEGWEEYRRAHGIAS